MSNEVYSQATQIYKELKQSGGIHGSIGRRSAIRAIYRVLEQEVEGEESPPTSTTYPCIHLILKEDKTYSPEYINQVYGTFKWLRGNYIGAKK